MNVLSFRSVRGKRLQFLRQTHSDRGEEPVKSCRSPFLGTVVAALCIAALPSCALSGGGEVSTATAPPSSWDEMVLRARGERVQIWRIDGSSIVGSVSSGNTGGLELVIGDASMEILPADVARVELIEGTRAKSARRGFLIGALAGAAHAALTTRSNQGFWMLSLGSGWGAIGALVGVLSGSGEDRLLLYEAPAQ